MQGSWQDHMGTSHLSAFISTFPEGISHQKRSPSHAVFNIHPTPFSLKNLISMETSFRHESIPVSAIITPCFTWHDSATVVLCTTLCCDYFIKNLRGKMEIFVAFELPWKPVLVKRDPAPRELNSNNDGVLLFNYIYTRHVTHVIF